MNDFLRFELFGHMKTCRGKLEHKHYVECLICTRLENCYTINLLSVKSELNFNLKVYGMRVMCGSSFLNKMIEVYNRMDLFCFSELRKNIIPCLLHLAFHFCQAMKEGQFNRHRMTS